MACHSSGQTKSQKQCCANARIEDNQSLQRRPAADKKRLKLIIVATNPSGGDDFIEVDIGTKLAHRPATPYLIR